MLPTTLPAALPQWVGAEQEIREVGGAQGRIGAKLPLAAQLPNPVDRALFLSQPAAFLGAMREEDLDPGNNPHGERDFSPVVVEGVKIYHKIDYYQAGTNYTEGAATPRDPKTTERLMTVMLPEEY
jgi:hypothetical protein